MAGPTFLPPYLPTITTTTITTCSVVRYCTRCQRPLQPHHEKHTHTQGNIQFQENNQEESTPTDPAVMQTVASLLQVSEEALTKSMCTRKIQMGIGSRKEV